jgi:uncharacterized membrane protein
MWSGLGPLLVVHVVSALVAIAAGAVTFLLPKGGRRHRQVALIYVAAMVVTTSVVAFVPATVLPFGDSGYGFFHLFIVVGLVSSLLGLFGLYKWRRTRDKAWLRMHQMRFSFSYAGLLMAGVSQPLTNPRFGLVGEMEPALFWLIFLAVNGAILGTAMIMVQRYVARGDPLRRYAMRV